MSYQWTLPHFATFIAITIAVAIICLPMIHKSPEKNAQNLSTLLFVILSLFSLLAFSQIIASKLVPDFVILDQTFSYNTFLIYSIVASLVIALATYQVHEYVVTSISCYALIFAALIFSTASHIYQDFSIQYLSIIVGISILIDLLVHLNARSRTSIKLQLSPNYSNRGLLISPLNTFVVITVSAANHIKEYNLSHDYLLLVASICAAGLIPGFSFWRLSLFSYPKSIFITLVFFQSSIIANVFFSINFQAIILSNLYFISVGKVFFLIFILYGIIISLGSYNSLSKNIKVLVALSLASVALLLSAKPTLVDNIAILFVLTITTIATILHQKNLSNLFISNYNLFALMISSIALYTLIAILHNYQSLSDSFINNINDYSNLDILYSPLLTITIITSLALLTFFRTSKFLSKHKISSINEHNISNRNILFPVQMKEQYVTTSLICLTQVFCLLIFYSYLDI